MPTGDDVAASITPADLLANHIENARRCTDARAQLEALIRWHQDSRP